MKVNPLEVLQNMGSDALIDMITRLNDFGIVSDEDDLGLSSVVIERWNEPCDDYISELGYTGGKIERCGNNIEDVGAVYAVYNSTCISFEVAMEYLQSFRNNIHDEINHSQV